MKLLLSENILGEVIVYGYWSIDALLPDRA
jgi:hypothetical protein